MPQVRLRNSMTGWVNGQPIMWEDGALTTVDQATASRMATKGEAEIQPEQGGGGDPDYASMTLEELRTAAQQAGIVGYLLMTVEQLIAALEAL